VIESQAQAGWHPDPEYPAHLMRWWDGSQWTQHTQLLLQRPMQPAAPQPYAQPRAGVGVGVGVGRYATPTMWQRNKTSATVLVVVAVYLVLAATTGIVLLGIMPVMMSITAIRRREPLAVVAVIAAALAVIMAFGALAH
jgi:hypothetical protein